MALVEHDTYDLVPACFGLPATAPETAVGEKASQFYLWFQGQQGAHSAAILIAHLLDAPGTFSGVRNSVFSSDRFSTRLTDWPWAGARMHTPARPMGLMAEAVNTRWFQIAHSKSLELSLTDMGEIFDGLSDSLLSSEWGLVDEALRVAHLNIMSVDAIVVFARVPYMARDHLQNWRSFVARAKEELARRGESDSTLLGL